ncbi:MULTISPECIES: TetR family transcriptional regulator [unclassified Burkholderia]|uniref:TetR family transcriptional regulator n=1 Tax=unclassified Burkholderia TaxID=2613784 RepID=UPI0014201AC5|nr:MULTISPECIES: TetR family transcriptional regulator [unclassified Burkholderia]NIE87069.1 TetR/AcrR family transcriptional regulator [Burkholderia sp. Tr-860]NIF65553.1 TetR/AcrR family transcriptional regulator [Burkholderia sp. Cy-647]NIF92334.1 TetR/AcrR family transcriptional regulator [Burkholderia sp. Cy-637]NIF97625.1 TetR/AcrR family transcriptional regulator [Burkholderia sp. Ax-1720]
MKQGSNTDAPDQGAQPARGTRRDESRRKYDPEQTKRNILEVATQEFSAMGLTGARVDAIAERTNTTKRMLYYYFDSKEGLYEAVLEKVYGDIRALELELNVGELSPDEGMRRLVEFTFDYHDRHRDFVRLVSIENIHGAKYLEQLKSFKNRNVSIIKTIEELLARGVESGDFRADIDAFDLHLMISSFCFHRVSNRYTFGAAFGRDPSAPRLRVRHRTMIADSVLGYIKR